MKHLTLVPEGGLCNRIYAITSAINFAKKHNLLLTVYWLKDWGMGAWFHDLFTLSSTVENVEIKDAGFLDFFKYAKPIKSNFFLPKLYQKINFGTTYFWYKERKSVEEWYLSNEKVSSFYLFHCQKFYPNNEFLNVLLPQKHIQKRIDEQAKLLSPNTIGIHIRRTDHVNAIKHSSSAAFIEKMQHEVALNTEVNFYVASDSLEEKQHLAAMFGRRIIAAKNVLKRNTKDGIVDALVELHTLASTKKIYGSFQSTYSALAAEIKNIPISIIQI